MNRKDRIKENEISEIVEVKLSGYAQKILIEGKHQDRPVLLFLHGGPGSPLPFSEGVRGAVPEITDNYILVSWDQLGCGINNHKIDTSFSVETFVNMTCELVTFLKTKFPNNDLYLFGVSWGSALATLTAEKIPDKLTGVFIYGQILSNLTFNEEVYERLLEPNILPENKKQKLLTIIDKNPKEIEDLKFVMQLIQKYTEGYVAKGGTNKLIFRLLRQSLTSPDYRLRDSLAMFSNEMVKGDFLKVLMEIDLREALANITIPYFIMQGDKDIVTSTKMIEEFVKTGINQNLAIEIIDNCGHMPNDYGMNRIIDIINSRI